MTHVFVVNEITFCLHLQYMFAGTGYSSYEPDLSSTISSKYPAENTLTGMIADISKIRKGDFVLFYVTGCKKFFGIFQADSEPFFNAKPSDYLGTQLQKYLPLRVLIKPYKVYAEGVSEQFALDDISLINHPYEMCWSMIYRKLTGMRGCSFLTDYETIYLESLLSKNNNSMVLTGNHYMYNSTTSTIMVSQSHFSYIAPSNIPLTIDTRLFYVQHSHEGHLQAYIAQNYDNPTSVLSAKLLSNNTIHKWIGNEVVCSVGEKRIDILLIAETVEEIIIRVIELKDESPLKYIIQWQIPWYIRWVDQYIAPNYIGKNVKIIPTIIAYPYKRNTKNQRQFESAKIAYNTNKPEQLTNSVVEPIECIYFDRTQFPIRFI